MPGTCSLGRCATSSRRILSRRRRPHGRLYVCNRPSFPRTIIWGRALLLEKRYAEAIDSFQREKELSPNSTMADLGLGQVYLAQGDYQQAVATLSKSAVSAAINYFFLSEAYAANGDKEKGLAMLQKAFEAGFHDFAALDASPYRSSLRKDSRFQQLNQHYRK